MQPPTALQSVHAYYERGDRSALPCIHHIFTLHVVLASPLQWISSILNQYNRHVYGPDSAIF